jgi:hypothetical protein
MKSWALRVSGDHPHILVSDSVELLLADDFDTAQERHLLIMQPVSLIDDAVHLIDQCQLFLRVGPLLDDMPECTMHMAA